MLSLTHRSSAPIYYLQAFGLSLTCRCFSLTHCRPESSPLSDTKLVKDAERHKNTNEARALRYNSDLEYRARSIARTVDWRNARFANDPEYRAKRNARNLARMNARYRSDAQFREHCLAVNHANWAKKDPVAREEHLQRSRLHNNQQYAHDYTFKQRLSLQLWLRRHIPSRKLTWRTHDAELHADPVARLCSGKGCGFERKLKLWMKRKDSDPALYDCYKCFTSDWVPEKVFPIGYEHVIFGSGKRVEPRPVPLHDAGGAPKDANLSSGVGTIS